MERGRPQREEQDPGLADQSAVIRIHYRPWACALQPRTPGQVTAHDQVLGRSLCHFPEHSLGVGQGG